MHTITTSYHFEITTSKRAMHVFGTVMSHSDEGTWVDIWCPEEPSLTQRIRVSHQDIWGAVEVLVRERMETAFASEKPFSFRCLV